MIGELAAFIAIAAAVAVVGAAAGILLGRRLDRGDDEPPEQVVADSPPRPADTEDGAADDGAERA